MKISEYSRDDIEGVVEETKQDAKNLIPWLPTPKECDYCGRYCDADVQYVEAQAMPVEVWQCPTEECSKRYYRDEKDVL